MTPAERALLKAEMLREIVGCYERRYPNYEHNDLDKIMFRRAAELEAEAELVSARSIHALVNAKLSEINKKADEEDRAASVAEPDSIETPEPAAKGSDNGERPQVSIHPFNALPRGSWTYAGEHNRLVAWLDAEIAKLAKQMDDRDEATRKVATAREGTIGRLVERAEKAEAGAAVLREALGAFGHRLCVRFGCPGECKRQVLSGCKRRADALATGAGEELLREVEAMRKFVEAFDNWDNPRDVPGRELALQHQLRAARAAIDEARK